MYGFNHLLHPLDSDHFMQANGRVGAVQAAVTPTVPEMAAFASDYCNQKPGQNQYQQQQWCATRTRSWYLAHGSFFSHQLRTCACMAWCKLTLMVANMMRMRQARWIWKLCAVCMQPCRHRQGLHKSVPQHMPQTKQQTPDCLLGKRKHTVLVTSGFRSRKKHIS